MKNRLSQSTRIVTLLAVITILSGYACLLPENCQADSLTVEIRTGELDFHQQLYAEQYCETLEQLEEILDDYGDYFSRIDPSILENYQISFELFAQGLEESRYSENPANLQKDLSRYVKHLSTVSSRLQPSSGKENQKLYHLVRNLRRELAILLDLVEDNLSELNRDGSFDKAIQMYVAHHLAANEVKITRLKQDVFAKQFEQAMQQYLVTLEQLSEDTRLLLLDSLQNLEVLKDFRLAEDWDKLIDLDFVQMEAVIRGLSAFDLDHTERGEPIIVYHEFIPPSHPVAPVAPAPPTGLPDVVMTPGSTKQASRHLSGSLGISSYQMPIYITQPVGRLTIEGWQNNMVSAKLSVTVEAETDHERENFLSEIRLDIGQEKGGYYVEVIFPRLTNPNTRVVTSKLEIMTPAKNRIICDHSFGKLTARQLFGGALIKGNNSDIELSNISGKLKVENSLGPIVVDRIKGNLTIVNHSGKIFVSHSSARTKITNSSGLVSVTNSEGELTIVNSGPVKVVDHIGTVDAENRNGSITLLNIVGDVSAYGSQQPLTVENVIGNVTLENRNADIRAFQISQSLYATTTYAEIIVSGVKGGLKLKGDHSDIYIDLIEGLSEVSKITSNSGTIHLSVSPEANLLVSAITIDGSIGSSFPIDIKEKGEARSGTLKLGDGSPNLILKGTHSDIIIREL